MNKTHCGSYERLYNVWNNMKQRCYNKNGKEYHRYGGRGITVCDEWVDDYAAFKAWAIEHGYDSNAPRGKCTLDRIDNDKGYSPDNCRFTDMKTQLRNMSKNRLVKYHGRMVPVSEASEMTGIGEGVIRRRMKLGMTESEMFAPATIQIEYHGKLCTVRELSEMTGISTNLIYERRKRGLTGEDLVSPKRTKKTIRR